MAAAAPVLVLLTGCVSTQTVAARARLADARIIASQSMTEVSQANPAISVSQPVVIREHTGTAIVVWLRNDSSHTLTDLPISVGVRTRTGSERYLNSAANLDYFDSHVAVLRPQASAPWVFTTGVRVPRGRPFATVGYSQLHPTLSHSLPSVAVALRAAHPTPGGLTLQVKLVNRSAIPQDDLPIYAVAVGDGGDVAAGSAAVVHLGTHGTATSNVTLLGSSRYRALQLIATPTIFN